MLENVLKSVSKMLEKALSAGQESDKSKPYIQCAKDLLDETIESFKKPTSNIETMASPKEPLTPEGQEAREELMP